MCNDFRGQHGRTLNGHGHEIDDARGKASLKVPYQQREWPHPELFIHRVELPQQGTKCTGKTPKAEPLRYCRK
jgi:hypothetical protein